MAKKIASRADYYGLKPGALAARSKRLLARARASMAELSAAWDDNFQGVTFDAELIIEKIDELLPVIDEGVSYLREPPEAFGGE